ncbi:MULTISPECIES: cell division ATP-binding protein FtsE [Brevibacillus]|jgi:cell division transport system ATP-binding protein|uniref:cell division ATP-binding protein FtsE n=1 Tax=Brevibacillus TaxID=55080 RepID=UPI000EE73E45|nr:MULTISPECIES: ABC transporter ATP-binding protein [Brevibacillus]MBU8713352.1 ATP-binding cassette domain-containing protein [Brevibacillus parabrevis]MDH6351679.1 cell division transport system ATP-binding protein [Brevibacillus sp. 1238]MDR4997548.1 ABC transporter ATP-binding protein [Brevibacillus parabrevis]MED2255849.1 ABC transporter ATP-binding protein [Brevibacillus parabrevis]NRQ55221.1 ABC transporter ATP-binding protein [Brevibacillus sp. HD1.4A]
MIRLQKLCKSYGERVILQDLDLHLEAGEFAFLQGRSGSGKSTLLKLLYREQTEFAGRIDINAVPIEQIRKFELRRMMGVIFQSFELLPRKTVMENVALAGEVVGKRWGEIEPEAQRLLARVGLLDRKDVFPDQLSGGEQQRVAIVRALLNRPRILLADEPTGNLDSETAFEVMQLLKELHVEENMAMLIVTHSERLVEQFPAKTWMMEQGRVRVV